MPRMFISYRRADTRETTNRIYDRLVQAFGKDNIFMDLTIPPGSHFVAEIEKAIMASKVMLVMIGDKWLTVQDKDGRRRLDDPVDYVRMEIEMGLRHGLRVIPVLVNGAGMPNATALPAGMYQLAFQNAAIIRGDSDANFEADINEKLIGELRSVMTTIAPVITLPASNVYRLIKRFEEQFDGAQWEDARETLAQIRSFSTIPPYFNPDRRERALWEAVPRWEREQAYNYLRRLFERREMIEFWEAVEGYWREYGGYDPDELIGRATWQSDETLYAPVFARIQAPVPPRSVALLLPTPFEWVSIPKGSVQLEQGDDPYRNMWGANETFTIPPFQIAKYPITNDQFQVFVDAEDGWCNADWWNCSYEAAFWREENNFSVRSEHHNCGDCPRENVSWYSAVAFTRWLSSKTGLVVSLPTEVQWQRAAQGDDGREYPWGNSDIRERCNWTEHETTPVRRYPRGASPYGVIDMSGNVWEWCLNTARTGLIELEEESVRSVRGGGFEPFRHNPAKLRCRYRYAFEASEMTSNVGFRIVMNN